MKSYQLKDNPGRKIKEGLAQNHELRKVSKLRRAKLEYFRKNIKEQEIMEENLMSKS